MLGVVVPISPPSSAKPAEFQTFPPARAAVSVLRLLLAVRTCAQTGRFKLLHDEVWQTNQ